MVIWMLNLGGNGTCNNPNPDPNPIRPYRFVQRSKIDRDNTRPIVYKI